jgi:hypothetical protein
MKRIFGSIVLGAALAAGSLAPAAAQAIPSGSYQQSCSNIRVRGDELIARCTNPQGTRVRSSISLDSCRRGDIANSNGQLVCNRNGYGRRRGGYGNGNGGYGNGGYGNGNGNGGYGNGNGNGGYGYGNGYAPAGSYQQSCRNVQSSGGVLTATCPAANGNLITSSIDPRQCRGMDIANRNGRLVCQ